MAKKQSTNYEESLHYGGKASVKFYPGAHYYSITDPEMNLKGARAGGATSLTGVMGKGQGLMLYPMYEMRKYLKNYLRSTTVEELIDSPLKLEDILKAGTDAHVKKSDRGKSVGTSAHAWVESYLKECLVYQAMTEEERAKANPFTAPDIPSVAELGTVLRQSYIDIFKAAKPKNIEEYRALAKMIFNDADIQEALHIEATMLNKSITAAKQWFDIHTIFVHGTEDTVYSRQLRVCGKYDADLSVTCSEKCNWCYLNGDEQKIIDILNEKGTDYQFTGRYITDFKSTNESSGAPKGIYPEYLAQCGVYDVAKTEEFPDIHYDGHLILNGSKNNGTFNTHYSFERERNRQWAISLAGLKETIYQAEQEVKASA